MLSRCTVLSSVSCCFGVHAVSRPSKYGLTNATASCLVTDTGYALLPAKLISVCPDTTKFLFWDNYHFTDAGMRLYANFALKTLLGSKNIGSN